MTPTRMAQRHYTPAAGSRRACVADPLAGAGAGRVATDTAAHAHGGAASAAPGARGQGFRHETLLYSGDDGFLRGTLSFIAEGLAGEEPMLVAVSRERLALLREALGDDAEQVRFADMHELGANPARIIPAWQQFLQEQGRDGGPLRGIGEPIWPGRSDAELTECERHESLLNVAFAGGRPWRLLCPYDVEGLDERVIAAARRNHPLIADERGSVCSHEYLQGEHAPGPFDGELEPPPAHAERMRFAEEDLRALREFLAAHAAAAQLGAERGERLVLAVSELASNSVRYGGGEGQLAVWRESGKLLCEVRDRGHILQPLIGRVCPTPGQPAGRGLWLVNHLCDLVQIRSGDGGSTVRLHMRPAVA